MGDEEESRQDQAQLQETLDALEDRIAEYEAKKAWYEAKLVELKNRRVKLYVELTGSPPAISNAGDDRELASFLGELEEMAGTLAASARRMEQRTRTLARRAAGSRRESYGTETGVGGDGGDRVDSSVMRELLQALIAGEAGGEGEQQAGPDARKLALQLLPRLLKD